jgi:hypothetical protein
MAAMTSTPDARASASRSTDDTPAKEAPAEAGSDMLQTISGMVYNGSYALGYGLVYAAVFVAQSLPQENPAMQGFRAGGRAAMGELGGS